MPGFELRELASAPLVTISLKATLKEAQEVFRRSGLRALVVVDQKGLLAGILERIVLEKALSFGLEEKVEGITDPEPPFLEANSLDQDLEQIKYWGSPCPLIVVGEGKRPLGVLRPLDLLCMPFKKPAYMHHLEKEPPWRVKTILKEVAEVATALGVKVFLVGGGVRDLLWGKEAFFDLDFVVSAKAKDMAEKVARALGGKVTAHSLFQTFKVTLGQGEILDIAQSRWEYYEAPARLPKVFPGPLYLDLLRRDFTINALALALNGAYKGQIIDFLGGIRDLKQRRLRVHHPLSFVDDPTRLFRAARYTIRFGLTPGPCFYKALALAKRYACLRLLSPARIQRELERVLEEVNPQETLSYLYDLGVFAEICGGPKNKGKVPLELFFNLVEGLPISPKDILQGLALIFEDQGPNWVKLFDFPPNRAQALQKELYRARDEVKKILHHRRLSKKVSWLESLSLPVILVLAVREPMVQGLVRDYLLRLKNIKPTLTGKDLKAMGIRPGPQIGQILRRLRQARLDGEVSSVEEEKKLIQKEFAHVFS